MAGGRTAVSIEREVKTTAEPPRLRVGRQSGVGGPRFRRRTSGDLDAPAPIPPL